MRVKVAFKSMAHAEHAAGLINAKNEKLGIATRLRPYIDQQTGKIHLTKMSEKRFEKWSKLPIKRKNAVREQAFIKEEAEHWNRKFGIE